MNQYVTCVREGVYNLTRGRRYELLAHNAEKQQVRVRSDRGRARWFPGLIFDLNGGPVISMTSWRFDDPVVDELSGQDETDNLVDVVINFDNGVQRWCMMATPDYLKHLLAPVSTSEPVDGGFVRGGNMYLAAKNLIVVRDLAAVTVQFVLSEMDRQGEIFDRTLPVGP